MDLACGSRDEIDFYFAPQFDRSSGERDAILRLIDSSSARARNEGDKTKEKYKNSSESLSFAPRAGARARLSIHFPFHSFVLEFYYLFIC